MVLKALPMYPYFLLIRSDTNALKKLNNCITKSQVNLAIPRFQFMFNLFDIVSRARRNAYLPKTMWDSLHIDSKELLATAY